MTRDEHHGSKRGGPHPRRKISAPIRAKSPPAGGVEEAKSGDGRQRIAKLIARAGLCSRRDAEAWIMEGRVNVNGAVLTSPALDVGPADVVLVDGEPLPAADKTRLFLFHKPRGLVTSDHDPEGRATIFDHLREHWPDGPRVVTIGRLDINTEGLLLLTNDGGLARVLELPETGWVRRYRVRAKGETDQAILDGLAAGVTIEGIEYAGIDAKLDRVQGANCWLTMGLREGKNREVKRVLEHIGLEVNRLIRLSFGPFQLLDLAEGAVEEVKTRILRDQLGPALAAKAGVDFSEPEPLAPIVAAPVRESRGGKGKVLRLPSRESATPRGRNFRDRDREDAVPETLQIRERPADGPRRHVSALRADPAGAAGPRKRVERTQTADRKNRSVAVERLVKARPEPAARRERDPAPRRERDPAPRRERDPAARRERDPAPRRERDPAPRRERDPAPRRERESSSSRRERENIPERSVGPVAGSKRPYATSPRVSQSALGKRERIARSGGAAAEPRAPRSRSERSFSDNRAARSEERASRQPRGMSEKTQPRGVSETQPRGVSETQPRGASEKTQPRGASERVPARIERAPARRERGFGQDDQRPPRRDSPSAGRGGKSAPRPARPERLDRPDGVRREKPSADRERGGRSAGRPATGRVSKREFGGKPRGPASGGKPNRSSSSGKPSSSKPQGRTPQARGPKGGKPAGGKPPRRPRG